MNKSKGKEIFEGNIVDQTMKLSKGVITEQEAEILEIMALMMKKYKSMGYKHPEDLTQIVKAVHIIQDLIMQRLARRVEPDIFPIKE